MAEFSVKSTFKYLVLSIILFLLIRCANQLPPPGGPVDKEPPQILDIYPQDGTLNFNDDHFEISFSEYVEKLSLLDAFFISPEVKNIEYDWSGTSVDIYFDDTLKTNTTYTVSIGSSIQDLNNKNNMVEAVNFAFSTGPKLDVGVITGKVFAKEPSGIMIFSYMKTDTFANPLLIKPKNASQVGENGEFKSLGLANGTYRIFAIKEENKNRIYNIGEDMFGAPFQEITLSDSISIFENLNFRLTKEDTIAPFISAVTMTDRNHILLEYSEFIDSSKVTIENFHLIDSVSSRITTPLFFFRINKGKSEYYLAINDSLSEDGKYYVISNNIYDKYGNERISDHFEFTISSAADTVAPSFKSVDTRYEEKKIDYLDPNFVLQFTDGISIDNFSNAIEIRYQDKPVNFKVTQLDAAAYQIKILSKLKSRQELALTLDNIGIKDAAGNELDTVKTILISTLSGREFSGVSGMVNVKQLDKNIIVVLTTAEKSGETYYTPLSQDRTFKFDRVLPGKYLLWCFVDSDNNSKFNYGSVEPFELSEKFYSYSDTLTLRARWPVGDIIISE